MAVVIDRVVLRQDGQSRSITTFEFMNLELSVRIRHVMSGNATFYSGELIVPQGEALQALRTRTETPRPGR
jgi:hypothetical protein